LILAIPFLLFFVGIIMIKNLEKTKPFVFYENGFGATSLNGRERFLFYRTMTNAKLVTHSTGKRLKARHINENLTIELWPEMELHTSKIMGKMG